MDAAKKAAKEAKAAEKAAKFAAKQGKQTTTAATSKPKPKKVTNVDTYDPKSVENGRYQWWEEQDFFKPKPGGETFVISIPPPNVTGSLHMGHALMIALQDTMIRHARMRGKTTAWIPGCDHAGISTQSVVENTLWKNEGKTRHDLGRETLVDMIWAWKDKYHKNITTQLKAMGGSMDWSREAFTMDDNLSKAVRTTFIQLHEEGIIYRENRLVNWCTALGTSLSNLEVDNEEIERRTLLSVPGYDRKVEFGVLTYFKYPIAGSDETITVATTRPETMLGDTGIAVHPTDERYQHLLGKHAQHPFIADRKLLIFGDDSVEKDFGTGAVKVTPAHDNNDFVRGKRARLESINIFTDDGILNQNAGTFAGVKRFDARYQVIDQLKAKGLYVKWEDNKMSIPRCAKSKDVIEPILKPQWWMHMDTLVGPAVEAVKDGTISIQPMSAEKEYYRWMEKMQPWCLSRQLWWGHQIPAYFVKIEGEAGDEADGNLWVCAETEEQAHERATSKFPGKKFTLVRDPDVLDTWFSSGLWPFSTLGWPEKTKDLEWLYPTSLLETGWDILFFWVARMIMMGLKMTGKVPFTEVYCHALIRDSEGRKMSKSLGNVIDPLDIIGGITLQALHEKLKLGNLASQEVARAEKYQKTAFPRGIPECGTDALRFALVNYTTGGTHDISFKIEVLEAERRFCNKIYQAINFVLKRLGDFTPSAQKVNTAPKSLAENWILKCFNDSAKSITKNIEEREFYETAVVLRTFWLNELCDVFIENTKGILDDESASSEEKESIKQTLYTVSDGALKLLHPITPYITEYLWQKMPRKPSDPPSIMIAQYPEGDEVFDEQKAEMYEKIIRIAEEARSFVSGMTGASGKLIVQPHKEEELITPQAVSIASLLSSQKGIKGTTVSSEPPSGSAKRDVMLIKRGEKGGKNIEELIASLHFYEDAPGANGAA